MALNNATKLMKLRSIRFLTPSCLSALHSEPIISRGAHTHRENTDKRKRSYALSVTALVGAGGAYVAYQIFKSDRVLAAELTSTAGEARADLPTFTLEEVSKHDNKDRRIWVTYKQGVYDITEFIPKHPGGGEKIMIAAGGSVDPFWLLYAAHKTPQVLELLEQYRIGNLSEEEAKISVQDLTDPYHAEPRRHPALQARSQKPFNAEPPLPLLADSFLTPNELFYVRNHMPVPEVDANKYRLEVEGFGIKRTNILTLDQIKKMPKVTITAAVQCSGNRRSEMVQVKPVKGLNWGPAAIGNATWTGVRLRDVLIAAGFKDNQPGVQHVQFEGLDTDVSNNPYGASIAIEKAMDPAGDVLLAYEMNGEPLSRDHGFPLRVIVPGTTGARCVKWLSKIIVSKVESDSHWQQNDYKGFSPSTDWDTVDFKSAPAIQELPVTSAICDPQPGQTVKVKNGKISLRGYAWSGGGRKIVRVDVTADQGKTWHVAKLQQDSAKHTRHWGWTLWTLDIPVPSGKQEVEVWTKAVDSSYNTQPETFENIWNLRGVLSNAYHRVKVRLS